MSITVNVTSETAASITIGGSTNAISVTASGGIGPAAVYDGTNTIGVSQLSGGVGVTISTTSGSLLISSYNTATIAGLAPVQSVAGRTGAIQLQAADVTAGTFAVARIPTISYTALSNVPLSFVPVTHTHSTTEVVGLTASFAPLVHTHGTADITGLSAQFDGLTATYAAISHTHGTAAITGLTASFAPITHTHSTANIVGLTAAITANSVQSVNGKAGQTISLAPADVTAVTSSITGISGASAATNVVVISQASFDAITTPSTATIYFIV
jgi:hypothetical protein